MAFNVDSNIFCGGHTWMFDGSLLWVGGTDTASTLSPVGVRNVRRLDPVAWTISTLPQIAEEFWYETAISLADRRVLMTGTSTAVPILTAPDLRGRQIFDSVGGWSPLDDNGFIPDEYPRLHVLQSGTVLMTGYDAQARILNPQAAGPGAWTAPPGLVSSVSRAAGGSVYLSYLNASGVRVERVIVIGGWWIPTPTSPPTPWRSIDVIDYPDAPGAAWQTNPAWDMGWERGQLNAVILPNRRILVLGGGGWTPTPPPGQPIPRFTPELLDPVALTWQQMADERHPRLYHALAGLLASGQVYSAGGEDTPGFPSSEHTLEVFSPTYLFVGGAPVITSVPSTIGYTGTFTVGATTFGSPVGTVVLIRSSSVTHHFDFDQRYVELSFNASGPTLIVDAPPSTGAAPPGYYLLFVVSAAGVPSEGRWVHVN
ncbi:MAG: galactose oxidase-like domain-containing protein [Planctomycetota bacterium]